MSTLSMFQPIWLFSFFYVSSTSINDKWKSPSFDYAHEDAHIDLFGKSNYAVCGLCDFMLGILIHINVFLYDVRNENEKYFAEYFYMNKVMNWEKHVRIFLLLIICLEEKEKRSAIGVLTDHEFSERHEILWMRIAVLSKLTLVCSLNTHTRTSYHTLERTFDKCGRSLCLAKCERSSVSHNVLVFRLFFRVEFTSPWCLFVGWATSHSICCIHHHRPIDPRPDSFETVQMKHVEPAFLLDKFSIYISCPCKQ